MVDLEEWIRTRAQRVKNPSRRKPDMDTAYNKADVIERQLREDNHKIWGWVIYRCTYSSDKDWADFMDRFRFYIHESLESDNGLDMLESLDYHVFEDHALFDAASPSTIQEHFRQCSKKAGIEFLLPMDRYSYPTPTLKDKKVPHTAPSTPQH